MNDLRHDLAMRDLTTEQNDAVNEARTVQNMTSRSTSEALEKILYLPFAVLDHGSLAVVDYMGDDESIVQAARLSYGRGNKQQKGSEGLIRYLMRHQHMSPFEMCEMTIHVKLPIFVARQWIRHRTASLNEMSARYSILDKEFYIPQPEHLAVQSTTNKQGRGDVLDPHTAKFVINMLKDDATRNYDHYELMLNEGDDADPDRSGLARELARMNLTLNTYTQWYWKSDLRNLLHFLGLRTDSHAQYEIRVYADLLYKIVQSWVPMAAQAFEDYDRGSVRLSAMEVKLIQDLARENANREIHPLHQHLSNYLHDKTPGPNTDKVYLERYNMNAREMNEFKNKFFS